MFGAEWNALRQQHDDAPDLWHRPIPGPLYWDFRCVRCGENVDRHPGLIARWRHRRAAPTPRAGAER